MSKAYQSDAQRSLDTGLETDLKGRTTYSGYLMLDKVLDAQQPLSNPPHHDEMLFIIQHQTSELWLKLIIHEIQAAIAAIQSDDLGPCQKILARVKQVQRQLFEQWAVLETLTPSEYIQFRDVLGPASGFQSLQYRMVEFLFGNKHAGMLKFFEHDKAQHQALTDVLNAPSLYAEFLLYLSRQGYAIPERHLNRDWAEPHEYDEGLLPVFQDIYENHEAHWSAYALCEQLVDVEDSFQLWRFRHMKTVERIIGYRAGTGGSKGVEFLRKALDLKFFPELLAVRTQIGS